MATFVVKSGAPGCCLQSPSLEAAAHSILPGPNPTRGRFALPTTLMPGVQALLGIHDLSGRQVAMIRGTSGTPLVWEGQNGIPVAPGVYLYRMEAGRHRQAGKIVVFR